MKRADIQAGPVYGYYDGRATSFTCYLPLVLLDTETWRVQHGAGSSAHITKAPGERLRASRRYGQSSYGMPAIRLRNAKFAERALALASTESFNWHGEVTDPETEGVLGTYILITNSGYLHGLYEPLREARELADQQRKEAAAAKERYEAEQEKKFCALAARLDALGIPTEAWRLKGGSRVPTSIHLSFEEFGQLLTLAETGH